MIHVIGEILRGGIIIALFIGSAVFVHELGHYLMARLRGVGVEAFAIGMGPKIVAWKRGGCEYSLRWLPIGGFVKLHQMVREEAEEQAREEKLEAMGEEEDGQTKPPPKSLGEAAHEDMQALYDKGLLTKLLVFGGGVTFNFITAIVGFVALFTMGTTVLMAPEVFVGELAEGSAFKTAGLLPGDSPVQIEGKRVAYLDEIQDAILAAAKDGTAKDGLDLRVKREGAELDMKLPAIQGPLDPANVAEKSYEFEALHGAWDPAPHIGGAIPFGPADKAGIKEGDFVVKVNGKPVKRWEEMAKTIRSSANEAVAFTVMRKGEETPKEIVVVCEEDTEQKGLGRAGIVAGSGRTTVMKEPFFTALVRAPGRAVGLFGRHAVANYEVFTKSSFEGIKKNVGGPVAIGSLIIRYARKGVDGLLDFFITINLVLAFMNLLPIPVLDGGFIVISFIEAAIRRPVPARVLTPIYAVFVVFFIGLALAVTYNDIRRLLF